MRMRMPAGIMAWTVMLALAASGCAGKHGPGGGEPLEGPAPGPRTCVPDQPKQVTIEITLDEDTVKGNDRIKEMTTQVCEGDKVVWEFTNDSGVDVKVELDQFYEEQKVEKQPDRLDFGLLGDKSTSVKKMKGAKGDIKAKVKKTDDAGVTLKYFIILKTPYLETSHDPRLEIIKPVI